jgi:hypothetical protein
MARKNGEIAQQIEPVAREKRRRHRDAMVDSGRSFRAIENGRKARDVDRRDRRVR